MWERLPVGRPMTRSSRLWNHHEDDRLPTIAHTWEIVSTYRGKSSVSYKSYIDELDTLTPDYVCSVIFTISQASS